MESNVPGPREGENNSSIHTPDGHELAGSIPAAVSSSGPELRSIPGCLRGACSSGRQRPTIAFSGSQSTTATPSGTAASGLPPVADGSKQQPGKFGAAADAQNPAVVAGVVRPPAWGQAAAELEELGSGSRAALFSSPGPTPDGVARDAYSPLGRSSGSSTLPKTPGGSGAGFEGGVSLTPDEYSKLVTAAARAKELEEERRELAEERERVARLAADAEAAFAALAAAKAEADLAREKAEAEADAARRHVHSPGPDVDALTDMVRAVRELAEMTAKPIRTSVKHSFEFLDGSRHPGLKRAQTTVDRDRAFAASPDPKDKSDVQSHIASLKSKILALSDDVSDWDFLKARESLVSAFYGLTCLREHKADGDSYAYSTFIREFDKARSGGKTTTLTKLKDALDTTESMERGGDVSAGSKLDTLFLKIDESFVPSNTSSFYSIYNSVLQKLELKQGVRPSRALASLEEVFRSSTTDTERAKNETQGAFKEWLDKESKDATSASLLEPFMSKVNDLDFADKSIASWKAQFRLMEQSSSFASGMADVERGSDSTPKSRSTPGRSSGQGGAHSVEDRLETLLSKIASIEDRLSISDSDFINALTYGELMGASAGSATDTSGRPAFFGDDWVAKYGVKGYSAPNDRSRKSINVKALCEACNIPFDPSTLPRNTRTLVGPQCPVCKHNGKITKWYYHENSEEFKKGGQEAKKPGERNASYYHNGGTCAFAYKLAHETAKADPSKKYLLEPLSPGQSPYGF